MINKHIVFAVVVFACICLNAAQPIYSQNQTPDKDEVVRLRAELVQLHAVVTDKKGGIVGDLKKEDFELLEEGHRQAISFFSHQRIGAGPAEPAVADRTGEGRKESGRLFGPLRSVVLFVDTLHLSGPNVLRAKQTLKQFVDERMTNQDIVMVVTSSGVSSGFEQFTQDRRLLHYLIDRITPWQVSPESRFTPHLAASVKRRDIDARAVALEIMQAEEGLSARGLPRNMMEQFVEGKATEVLAMAAQRRKALLSVLRAVAQSLANLPGQRLILLVSDGFSMMDVHGGTDTSDVQSVISKAVRTGVKIYSMDAKGLQPPAEFDASRPGVPATGRTLGLLSSYMSASERDVQDAMNALASDTGGMFFRNTNDLKGSLQNAINDNREYYVLAYYPSDLKDSNKFRRIIVRVKDHPEYKVRAQSGYFISDFKKSEEKNAVISPQQRLFQAVAGPLPLTNLRVGAAASHVEVDSDSKQISLQAWIDGENLTYREQNGRFQIELDVATVVNDRMGKPVSTGSETIRGSIASDQLETVKRLGFRYATRIAVKPGHYQVRVGVSENDSQRIGTAISWVDVPNLTAEKLTLSDILLSQVADESQKRMNGAAVASISPWFGVRYFGQNTSLIYELMIYTAPSSNPESELVIQRKLMRVGRAIYQSAQEPLASRLVRREKKGLSSGGQLKLDLEPGIYDLLVSITNTKTRQTVQKAVTFGISR